jgi:hypothetical protein
MYEADLAVLERGGGTLPCELVGVLRTALARSREQRFQSARDFEDAVNDVARRAGVSWSDSQLSAWLGGLGILPPAVHLEAAPAPPPDQHPGRRPTPPARHMTPPRLILMPQGAQYLVKTPSAATVGPVSISEVLAGIATGELPPGTEVAEDGGGWQPLGSVGVFGTLAERTPFRFHDPLDARVTWRRELSRQRWPGILFSLVRQRETGVMVVRAEHRQKRVFWETGAPRFVSSTERTELLGACLVAAGLLDIGDLDRTVMFAAERGQRLGEMLVALGILRPTALLRALIDQLETRFIELGGWRSGEVLFLRGERTAEDRVASRSSGLALVARTLHEGYADAEIGELLAPFLGSPIARLPSRVEIGELGLTPPQRRALELAPGAASLQALMTELARNAGARHPDTLRGVFTGLACGLLVTPGWPTMA